MSTDTTIEYSSQIRKLIKDLMGTEAMAREKARLALIEIGKPTIEYLAELTYSQKDIWRWEAVKALAKIGEPETVPILLDALEDKNSGVRWLAAEGLSRFGLDVVRPLLKAFIERPNSIFLNQGIHHVLYQLRKDVNFDSRLTHFLTSLKTPGFSENTLIEAKNLIEYFNRKLN